MKMKLNSRVGPNSNCEKTLWLPKINDFTLGFLKRKASFKLLDKISPNQKTIWPVLKLKVI